jgi:hypothetical protein
MSIEYRNLDVHFVVDTRPLGFTRLRLNKLLINSVALIHERVLPFYDCHGIQIRTILIDCGREYCEQVDNHFYEIYLASQGIEHRNTRPASPFTNGFVEKSHTISKKTSPLQRFSGRNGIAPSKTSEGSGCLPRSPQRASSTLRLPFQGKDCNGYVQDSSHQIEG